jgi:hypothetical protein
MARRHNIQTVSWFYDLSQRKLLDLDPPYQRRSVWSQEFKDYFIDTVLLNYPAPALFVYEDITPEGRSVYHVVDGKQRLTTLFEFIRGDFPVNEKSGTAASRGKYFGSFDDESKKAFWGYQFLVEYVPSDDEKVINGIFDRINRNVAKLTPQELRHARLAGEFISSAESLSAWMTDLMPKNFPRFASQSRSQMKDVEFVSLLMLLLEEGPKGYSQDGLDQAFTDRDASWDTRIEVENAFRDTTQAVKAIIESSETAKDLIASRLKNQADYYALFGAVHGLKSTRQLPHPTEAAARLLKFTTDVENDEMRAKDAALNGYFDAARSASNDKGPREERINYIKNLLTA